MNAPMTAHNDNYENDVGESWYADAAQIQQGHDGYKNRRQHRVRNKGEKALDSQCSVNPVHEWLNQVIERPQLAWPFGFVSAEAASRPRRRSSRSPSLSSIRFSLRERFWISDSARRLTSKSNSLRRRSFLSWRFWLIMMTGAWMAASMERKRFSRMNG